MYAIIVSGGKQYRVAKNEVLKVEKLVNAIGNPVAFDKVLMVADGEKIYTGNPCLGNAKVLGEVVEQGRGEKIRIIKFRRRKHYMKHQGHRQYYTAVRIKDIVM